MTAERCEKCNRAECDVASAMQAYESTSATELLARHGPEKTNRVLRAQLRRIDDARSDCVANAVDWREVAYELAKRYTAAMITYAPGTYDARDTLDSAIAEVRARGKR